MPDNASSHAKTDRDWIDRREIAGVKFHEGRAKMAQWVSGAIGEYKEIITQIDETPPGRMNVVALDIAGGDTQCCLAIRDSMNRAQERKAFGIIFVKRATGPASLIALSKCCRAGVRGGTFGDWSKVGLQKHELAKIANEAIYWNKPTNGGSIDKDAIAFLTGGLTMPMSDAVSLGLVEMLVEGEPSTFDDQEIENRVLPAIMMCREALGELV